MHVSVCVCNTTYNMYNVVIGLWVIQILQEIVI